MRTEHTQGNEDMAEDTSFLDSNYLRAAHERRHVSIDLAAQRDILSAGVEVGVVTRIDFILLISYWTNHVLNIRHQRLSAERRDDGALNAAERLAIGRLAAMRAHLGSDAFDAIFAGDAQLWVMTHRVTVDEVARLIRGDVAFTSWPDEAPEISAEVMMLIVVDEDDDAVESRDGAAPDTPTECEVFVGPTDGPRAIRLRPHDAAVTPVNAFGGLHAGAFISD